MPGAFITVSVKKCGLVVSKDWRKQQVWRPNYRLDSCLHPPIRLMQGYDGCRVVFDRYPKRSLKDKDGDISRAYSTDVAIGNWVFILAVFLLFFYDIRLTMTLKYLTLSSSATKANLTTICSLTVCRRISHSSALWSCVEIHCVQKKTPTHIFFHISMNYLWIWTKIAVNIPKDW